MARTKLKKTQPVAHVITPALAVAVYGMWCAMGLVGAPLFQRLLVRPHAEEVWTELKEVTGDEAEAEEYEWRRQVHSYEKSWELFLLPRSSERWFLGAGISALLVSGLYLFASIRPLGERSAMSVFYWASGLHIVHSVGLAALGLSTVSLLGWMLVLLWLPGACANVVLLVSVARDSRDSQSRGSVPT